MPDTPSAHRPSGSRPDTRRTPWQVRAAAAGIGMHAVGHLWVLLASLPLALNVGNVFHATYAIAYIMLSALIRRGGNWTRLLITMLLVNQFIGRFEIFFGFPDPTVRAMNLVGWALSTVIITLLWAPATARRFFTDFAALSPSIRAGRRTR